MPDFVDPEESERIATWTVLLESKSNDSINLSTEKGLDQPEKSRHFCPDEAPGQDSDVADPLQFAQ